MARLIPINEITPELLVVSINSGVHFRVTGSCKYALNCEVAMVTYVNIDPTYDSPIGTSWVLEESIFRKRFFTFEDACYG